MWYRELVSTLLVPLICLPLQSSVQSQQESPASNSRGRSSPIALKLLKLTPGAAVRITMRDRESFNARLGTLASDRFQVQYVQSNRIVDRDVAIAQVESLIEIEPGRAAEPGRTLPIPQQIVSISRGATVEVRLHDKSKHRGRMGELRADGFLLEPAQGQPAGEQLLPFARVKSARELVKAKPAGYIFYGFAITGAAVLIACLVSALKSH